MSGLGQGGALRAELARRLDQARTLTHSLLEGLDGAQLSCQYDPEFSPIAWHYGHVAWQEECFVGRRVAGHAPLFPELDQLLDPAVSAKHMRSLKLPERAFLDAYARRVRQVTLGLLAEVEFADTELLRAGHVFRFAANHELQHAEIIATVRMLGGLDLAFGAALPAAVPGPAKVHVPGAELVIGSDDDPDRWDNEQPAHRVEVAEFWLGREPVSSAEWLEFMREGGYERRSLWSESGWQWRSRSGLARPLHWHQGEGGGWLRRDLRGIAPLPLLEPVQHVSWHEAQAFARFAGGRLPTEAEWELAARADSGARNMIGGVWEWLADTFGPYPGFRPQPYAEYSAPWFDGRHRVARGGSYLTASPLARPTFRNWYLEHIRQPVLGVRLAFDRA